MIVARRQLVMRARGKAPGEDAPACHLVAFPRAKRPQDKRAFHRRLIRTS
jgi:hypothetical protein